MDAKKMVKIGVFVVFLMGSASIAFAASAWYTCNLKEVGQDFAGGTSTVYLRLTDTGGAFQNKWFRLDTEVDRSLATALTAGSLSKYIKIYTDLTSGTYPTIKNLYVAF